MDLIVFSGQSNMQGQSERLSDCHAVNGAFEYKWLTDRIVPLRDPVGENVTYLGGEGYDFEKGTSASTWLKAHALGAACYGHTGLVPSFCKTYVERTGREVLAVHAAKGSTRIADWLPDRPIYELLVKKARGAIRATEPEHLFFVWLQGESDALAGTAQEDYERSLRLLCNALQTDLGIERFGIIRVGRFTDDDRDNAILAAQDAVCAEQGSFVMLTTLATELCRQSDCMNPEVRGHYSAKGLELLGRAAASTLAALL